MTSQVHREAGGTILQGYATGVFRDWRCLNIRTALEDFSFLHSFLSVVIPRGGPPERGSGTDAHMGRETPRSTGMAWGSETGLARMPVEGILSCRLVLWVNGTQSH